MSATLYAPHVTPIGPILVDKYEVLRYGEPVGDCFVLRYDRDPHALVALAAYAASVRESNLELSEDLWRTVKVHSGQPFAEPRDG